MVTKGDKDATLIRVGIIGGTGLGKIAGAIAEAIDPRCPTVTSSIGGSYEYVINKSPWDDLAIFPIKLELPGYVENTAKARKTYQKNRDKRKKRNKAKRRR